MKAPRAYGSLVLCLVALGGCAAPKGYQAEQLKAGNNSKTLYTPVKPGPEAGTREKLDKALKNPGR